MRHETLLNMGGVLIHGPLSQRKEIVMNAWKGYRNAAARVIAGVCLLTAAGCTEPMSNTSKGALLGAGIGAGTGALAGGGKGAAIGAAVGGVGGAIVGNQMDRNERGRYDDEYEQERQRQEYERQRLEDERRRDRRDRRDDDY